MEKFTSHTGQIAPLMRDHIDTDVIIPKQFLKAVSRFGFGDYLFDEWRYLDIGQYGQDCSKRPKNPDFVLNQAAYENATILLAGQNFGCGSSREHAPWAMLQYGFKAVIAIGFADIFFSNAYKNGLLPIALPQDVVLELNRRVENINNYQITIDLAAQTVHFPAVLNHEVLKSESALELEAQTHHFEITEFRKNCLLNGLDEVGLTLAKSAEIHAFEDKYFNQYPWLKKGII